MKKLIIVAIMAIMSLACTEREVPTVSTADSAIAFTSCTIDAGKG